MQNRNFIVFIVLAVGILIGWTWLSSQWWPTPSKKKDEPRAEKFDLQKHKEVVDVAGAVGRAALPSWGGVLLDVHELPAPKPFRYEDVPRDLRPALVMLPPQMPGALGLLAHFLPKPMPPQTKPQTIVLGGEDYHLQATLTTLGAGVQKLVLNHFKGVDWVGQSTKTELELIQEDPYVPSFLMFHWPDPNPDLKGNRPSLALGQQPWKLVGKTTDKDGVQQVVLSTQAPAPFNHLNITKTYRLGKSDYHLGMVLDISYDGVAEGEKAPTFRYQLSGSHGMPIEGEWYTATFRTAAVGMLEPNGSLVRAVRDSVYVSSREGGDKIPDQRSQTMIQYAGVMTQYFASLIVVDPEQPKARDILAWARATLESQEVKGRIVKIGQDGLRFRAADARVDSSYLLLPRVEKHLAQTKLKEGAAVVLSYYELPDDACKALGVDPGSRVATWIRPGQTPRPYFDDMTVRVNSEPIELKARGKVSHHYLLYHGPVKTKLLGYLGGEMAVPGDLVDKYTHTLHLNTLTDYHSDNPFGKFANFIKWTQLLILCTHVMHWLLNLLQTLVPMPGLCIILLTVVVRGAMYPISRKQALFALRMQELAPEMKKINEKFKKDPQGKMAAVKELYRKHKVNPFASCLPLIMQMPIFLGLYYALQESVFFRLAGFFPGDSLWIKNLAAPDMLFWWGEGIPWISDPDSLGGLLYLGPYFNLLPIAAVVLMILQQKYLTPPPTDADQAAQHRMMRIMMGVMGLMFYKVASGLCIYFIASSLWGLAERRLLPKKKDPAKMTAPAPPPGKPGPGKGPKGKGPAKKEEATAFRKVKDWWQNILKQAEKK